MDKKTRDIIIIILLAAMVIWLAGTANTLVGLHEDVQLKASQVEATMQRRSDLIPNLVATVKGYVSHEEKVFTEIAEARTNLANAISTGNLDKIQSANADLTVALGKLLAIQEDYPDLQSDVLFIGLMDELAGSENRINVARQRYNDAVAIYNKKLQMFPSNGVAKLYGFEPAEYFEADDEANEVPKVGF